MMDSLDMMKNMAIRAGRLQASIDEMGLGDPLKKKLAELKAENERLRKLNIALERLLVCYRIGTRPSGKLLDEITRLKDAAPKEATK